MLKKNKIANKSNGTQKNAKAYWSLIEMFLSNIVWLPHQLTWTWSPNFVIYEKYTYSRVNNRSLPHHNWWAIFLRWSPPRGPFPQGPN